MIAYIVYYGKIARATFRLFMWPKQLKFLIESGAIGSNAAR